MKTTTNLRMPDDYGIISGNRSSLATITNPVTEAAVNNATNKYQTESGASALRPITSIDPTIAGNITGSITPAIPAEAVAINSKGIHYYGMVYNTGEFQISALTAGTYTVTIIPGKTTPYYPISVLNIVVRPSATTNIALSFYVEQ